MKILLIEDTAIMAELLIKMLIEMNCEVDWAENGQDGLDKHKNNIYQLIISDYCLPDMKGCDVAEKIRLSDSKTPIIGLTSYVSEIEKQDWIQKGAYEVYFKPMALTDLNEVVEKFR